MHELLAPLYYAVRFDAINEGSVQEEQYKNLAKLCSSEFIAADSWALFDTVMNGVYKWYEWREPSDTPSSPFQNQVTLPESGMQPYVAPIVQICNHIQCNLLRTCDPLLYQSMQRAGIEPQIYGM
jgi:TBC1 domain family protein 5